MKIVDLSLQSYMIPFRAGLSWTPGTMDIRMGWIVVARAENGMIGLGEIGPLRMRSMESPAEMESHSRSALKRIRGADIPRDFDSLNDLMENVVDVQTPEARHLAPSAIFGIETALADLASKAAGLTLAEWINPDALNKVRVNAILTGCIEEVERAIQKKRETRFTTFKMKVGRDSLEHDLEKVALLREMVGEGAVIRLDANRAWDFNQAVEALDRLKDYRIEYIEEPLDGLLLAEIPKLRGIDIALDETVKEEKWLDNLIRTEAVRVVIVKPSVAGGIARSLALARRVREFGKEVVVTSTFESGVGLAACVHVAAAIGGELPPCGFDTLDYLEESLINEELPVRNATIEVPQTPGLGVTLKAKARE